MNELLPCPFCGYKPHIHGSELFGYVVHCLTVGCPSNPSSNSRKTEQEAIEAWNTRKERTCEGCKYDGTDILDYSPCDTYGRSY